MTTNNEDPKSGDNMELPKPQAAACGSGCGCHAAGSAGKTRWIVGVLILAVAGALAARAVIKNNRTATAPASAGYAAPAQATKSTDVAGSQVTVKEIGAFAELNTLAADMAGVCVFLPERSASTDQAPMTQIHSAARTIGSRMQGKIGVFTLKRGSPDYVQVVAQMTAPGVLAMVKGRGMAPLSGEITEAKLVQAFVTASSAGGCGPSAGGCGPSSAGCK